MGNLYENLKKLCDERDIKGGKMCTDLGLSKSLMTDLKAGRKRSITLPTAQKIADYFGVSVDDILGGKEKPSAKGGELVEGLPKEVQRLIAVCLAKPGLATSLLSVLQQLENDPSAQG